MWETERKNASFSQSRVGFALGNEIINAIKSTIKVFLTALTVEPHRKSKAYKFSCIFLWICPLSWTVKAGEEGSPGYCYSFFVHVIMMTPSPG